MTGSEYQGKAMHLESKVMTFDARLTNAALGMSGESGEVADLIKKYLYQGHPLKREKLIEELGDVMWYVAEAADAFDITLDEVMDGNLAKLKERYPNGFFEAERSINRKERNDAE